jgi:hypothetical protein
MPDVNATPQQNEHLKQNPLKLSLHRPQLHQNGRDFEFVS